MNIKDITPPILLAELKNIDQQAITEIETLIQKLEFPIITDINEDEIVISFEVN